jgi:hypothetical protein
MPARSNSGKTTKSLLILLLLGAVVLAATGAYVQLLPRAHPSQASFALGARTTDDSTPISQDRPDKAPPVREQSKQTLLLPLVHGDDVVLTSGSDQPGPAEEPAVFLANQSLKAVHADSAKALSVQVKDRVALIDFSQEIEDGFGSSQEASFIKALQVSLGQLPDVDRFQITVGGQPIESLGHFEVTDPIDVIRPTAKP